MVRSAAAIAAVLILPGFASAQQAATHTVVKGDCLWNLAKEYYNDPFDWRRIWEANRSQIQDPNLIYPGQVFTIPGKEAAAVSNVTVEAAPRAPTAAPPPPSRESMAQRRTIFRQDTSVMMSGIIRSGERQYLPVPRDLVYSAPWVVRGQRQPAHTGQLAGFAGGESRAHTPRSYDRVVVKMTGGTPEVGAELQTFRVTKTIPDVGNVVTPTGVVTVSEVSDAGVVATVSREFAHMALDDFVGPLPTYTLQPGQLARAVAGGGEAMVMGFAGSAVLHDVGSIAFLDQGSDDGVNVGDEYEYIDHKAGEHYVAGRIQVVGVTSSMASARILSMRDIVFKQGLVVQLARKMQP